MSLQDRDWYRRQLADKDRKRRSAILDQGRRIQTAFVQLPLPTMKVTTSTRIKRALRRALRSEWFNVGLALAVAAVALAYFA